MRQVQARAVRQECAEGVEEVERGGCRERWELRKGGSRLPGNKKGQRGVSSFFPPTISLVSGWGSLGKSEPGDP